MNRILENKPKTLNRKNDEVVDFTEKSFQLGVERVEIESFGYVVDKMVMRPDLFAGVYSDKEEDFDMILKFNRISNPFILNEGNFLAVPKKKSMNELFLTEAKRLQNKAKVDGSKDNVRNKVKDFLNPFPKENTQTNTFNDFKKKYEQLEEQRKLEEAKKLQGGDSNDSQNLLPPNFSDENKKEITTTPNGTVILGTSVADTETSCGKKNVTKAELLNTLIKNRAINR